MSASEQASLGLRVASGVFGLASGAHLLRLWSGWNIQVGDYQMGVGASAAAIFLSAGLSLWLRKLAVGLERPARPRESD
jgi:hypothetical protein